MPGKTIEEVKRRYEARLLAVPGVVSVGIGLNEESKKVIRIGTVAAVSNRESIPSSLEGYEVVVSVTGVIKVQTDPGMDRGDQ